MPEWIWNETENVAPFAGAWIEIYEIDGYPKSEAVAPFAGAWIEIFLAPNLPDSLHVAPFAGAWIEIIRDTIESVQRRSRSLRGSVD